jgi:HD superfamily phosphohydrolase
MINIRDPIHGTIALSPREIRVVDSPFFQRLRNVKQLGFADLAFPGATHTRYSHSLGAMHVATRLFDVLFPPSAGGEPVHHRTWQPPALSSAERERFRQAVRLAVLFHDVGHAPLSHTTELIMPSVTALKIPRADSHLLRQATHEDYTLKILMDSPLSQTLEQHFAGDGLSPRQVADLVHPDALHADKPWMAQGLDFGPLLHQLVSSELDADRMDYLQQDSFYSGVNYGKFDADWLIQNVVPVVVDGQVFLGVAARAIFSFEDFLLSRYHMFLTVYYHHTPVCFGEMLARYFDTAPGEYTLPADVEQYIQHDDVSLMMNLRQSSNIWADRIRNRRALKLLKEDSRGGDGARSNAAARLQAEGIHAFEHTSKGVLSKYFLPAPRGTARKAGQPAIYVVEDQGSITPIEEFTPLYKRYQDTVKVWRLYVDPAQAERALAILG